MARFILLIIISFNLFYSNSQCGASIPNNTPSLPNNGTFTINAGQVYKGQNLGSITINNYGTLFIESASSHTIIRNHGTIYLMSNLNLLTLHNYNQAYLQTAGAIILYNYKSLTLCNSSALNGSTKINNYSNANITAVNQNSVVVDVAGGACNFGAMTNLNFTTMNNPLHNCGTLTNTNASKLDNNCSACGGPLPVELIAFSAKAGNQQVALSWSTASERNNDYFTIEKTIDGIHYTFVAEVKGAGNSSIVKNYSATDYAPLAGTAYYRLTQTDFNGEKEVFEPKSVYLAQTTTITNVYPNPVADSRLNVVIAAPGDVVINIYNLYGQLVKTQAIDSHVASTTEQIELPEGGNTFLVELIQNNVAVGHHKVMVIK